MPGSTVFRIINMHLLCEKSVLPGIGILKITLCAGSQNSLNLLFLVMLHNMVILFFLQKHDFTLKRGCSIKMRFVGVINQNCVKILVRVSLYTSMFYIVTRKTCVFKVFHTEYTDLERAENCKFYTLLSVNRSFLNLQNQFYQ